MRELKHWERHANAIELQDDKTANVFYIMRWSDGALWMGTQRVSSWHVEFSPSDAIEALQEAIAWIRENTTTVNPPEST